MRLVTGSMHLAMMHPAKWYGVLVTNLASERTGLSEAEMMGIRRLAPADQAGVGGDELEVLFVAIASRLADRQHAFVDASPDPPPRSVHLGQLNLNRITVGVSDSWRISIRTLWSGALEWEATRRRGFSHCGPPIHTAKELLLLPKCLFDKFGVFRAQAVLDRQLPERPRRHLLS